jgi:hypothetical protein
MVSFEQWCAVLFWGECWITEAASKSAIDRSISLEILASLLAKSTVLR